MTIIGTNACVFFMTCIGGRPSIGSSTERTSQPALTSSSSITLEGWPTMPSAACWQAMHEAVHGTAASASC